MTGWRSKALETITVALAQMRGVYGDKARNMARILDLIGEAARRGADLICFPEASLTGYRADGILHLVEMADALDDDSVMRLRAAARAHRVCVLLPFLERRMEGVYNSAVFIDDRGEIIGSYSKTHLISSEKGTLLPGDRLAVWDTPLGRIGCLICYDICFPETARALAMKGAQLIVVPSAWRAGDYFSRWWDLNIACRAVDNVVYVAGVNQVGPCGEEAFAGRSKACGPTGEVIAQCGDAQEALAVARIDLRRLEEARSESAMLEEMRPELYGI